MGLTRRNLPHEEKHLIELDSLSDDSLALVLSYLDLASAVTFSRRVSRYWQQRSASATCSTTVWQELFQRQAFSSEDLPRTCGAQDVLLRECKYRRRLQQTLFGRGRQQQQQLVHDNSGRTRPNHHHNCFHLPNRLYSFLSIVPDDLPPLLLGDNSTPRHDDDDDEHHHSSWWWDDPPPVHWDCESFLLTSTAVHEELLVLCPFSKSLAVYSSVLDNAEVYHSDEGTMERHAIREAAEESLTDSTHSQEEEEQQQNLETATTTASTTGASASNAVVPEDVSDLPANKKTYSSDDDDEEEDEAVSQALLEEYQLAAKEIEETIRRSLQSMKQIYNRTAAKHTLISSQDTILDIDLMAYFWEQAPHRNNNRTGDDEEDGVEVEIAYIGIEAKPVLDVQSKLPTGTTMMAVGRAIHNVAARVDRPEPLLECLEVVAWFRNALDADMAKYVCRLRGEFLAVECCASQRRVYVNPLVPRGAEEARQASRRIYAYPMVPYSREPSQTAAPPDPSKYFPRSSFVMHCKEPVETMGVCATGTRVVASTTSRNVLFWNVQDDVPILQDTIPLHTALHRAFGSRVDLLSATHTLAAPVVSIHCPLAVPIDTCGFCTLLYALPQGSTILVWYFTNKAEPAWSIHSMINLPLTAGRRPKVHYDGNRLIVFGQDHIGFIILVYRVLSTTEHLAAAQLDDDDDGRCNHVEEASGGVIHATAPARVHFVNRIRHAALGGIDSFESLRMTCNERFIVVNTKTGNLLSGGTDPFREGLLIIDLEQDQHQL